MTTIQTIPLEHLRLSQTASQVQRRKHFDKERLADLVASVTAHGVLQPIIVRHHAAERAAGVQVPEYYELVAGERRYLAAKEAKLDAIPANVLDLTDEQVIEIQLIENLQREDVHPMQEAEGYHELVHKYGHAIDDVYSRVGKSRSYVYARMKLLALAPKCREAFYSGTIDASVALLLARIPVEATQVEALKTVTQSDWSYRDAARIIRDQFMLRLSEATFPTKEELAGVGPCAACPKRTGNQPELFGDIKSADVCTDIVCFRAKTRAFGQRRIELAKQSGQPVIVGKEAKRIAPRGVGSSLDDAYVELDRETYVGGKWQRVRKALPKGTEITLLQDPDTGAAVEIVKRSVVEKDERSSSNPSRAAEKKTKAERAFRAALYAELRPRLEAPKPADIARHLFRALRHDEKVLLAKVRGFEPKEKKIYGSIQRDFDGMADELHGMSDAGVAEFINDCIYLGELQVHSYDSRKPERLLTAAKSAGVDVAKIRRDLTPKKKLNKKPAAQKRRATTTQKEPR